MPTTPNHGWVTPTVGASADTWGGLLNAVVDDQDALLAGGQNTILGRITSGTGPMIALTAAQATSALAAFTGDSGAGGVKGLVPAPAAGDAAAGKVLGAGGGWVSVSRALGVFNGTTGAAIGTPTNISIVRNSTGTYTATFAVPLPDANYAVFINVQSQSSTPSELYGCDVMSTDKTASGFRFYVKAVPAGGDTQVTDPAQIYLQVIRP